VRKTRMEQKTTREWNERKRLVTPQQIIQMKTCPHSLYCTKLVREPREERYSLEQAVDVRNWLVFRLCIENGSRAGPIHAMTLVDMRDNERLDGKRVIHVAHHKTTATYGGALLNMSEELFQDLFRYIRGAREVFLKEENKEVAEVFLGQYGNPLSGSYIHRALKSFAGKTFVLPDEVVETFCSTMVRKVCVTNTRDHTEAEKTNIASLMVHSSVTAERSYSLQNRIQQSSSGHDAVRALFGSPKKGAKSDEEGSINTVPPSPVLGKVSVVRRAAWTKEDEEVIKKKARRIICGVVESTKLNILKTIRTSSTLTNIAGREGELRLYEKIKALKRKYNAQD